MPDTPSFLAGGPPVPPPADTSQLPTTSNAPAQAPQASVQAPQAPPQQPTAEQHHSLLGRAVRNMASALEGKQITYAPDPETGDVREVVTPRKPGGLFRDLVLGALVGGAAGAQAPTGSGALGGFASGAVATQQAMQNKDDTMRQRAMQSAKLQKSAYDENQQKLTQDQQAQATIAHDNLSTLELGHNVGFHDDKAVDGHNNAADIVSKAALDNGGAVSQVEHNGEKGNGPALMQAFNQDPSIMQGPEGFHRFTSVKYDTSGLEHKDGQWVDPKTSKPPDWNSRATVTLIDLPNAAWGKSIQLPGDAANTVAGRKIAPEGSGNVQASFGSLFSLGLKNKQDMNKQMAETRRPPKNEAEAKGWAARIDGIKDQLKSDPNSVSDDDKKFLADKGPMISSYNFKEDKPTPTQIKLQTESLNKKLAAYAEGSGPAPSQEERATLVQRQKEDASKGVPADIVAAIGIRPVPADFDKGESDPAFKAASKLWGDASLNKKAALQASAGLARYQMLGEIKDYNITNTTDNPLDMGGGNVLAPGEMGRVTANQLRKLPPGAILNTQDGTKILSKTAAIRDIQSNIDNVREKIGALDNLDVGTRAKLIYALHDPDPSSALSTFKTSEAKALSDPKLQDAIIAMQQMAENVMVARSIQGIGGAGSDQMRRALMNLVPDATTPSKVYAGKQLDAFQRTFNQLKTGVPTLGGKSNEPVSGARNQSTTTPQVPKELPVNQLKEGVHTKFGNGQVWTLKSGKPVQVQGQ